MKLRSSSSMVKKETEETPIEKNQEEQVAAVSAELDLMASNEQDVQQAAVSAEFALMDPFKSDQMPTTELDMQKQVGGKCAMSSVVDTAYNPLSSVVDTNAYDPLLVQINTARLTHANTVSLMINNTAQVYSQRVSDAFITALKQLTETRPLPLPLSALDMPISEMTDRFTFGSVEAIGMMKGITDGVLRVLHQLIEQNPDVELELDNSKIEEKLLKPWAMIIKRITNDLQKACIGFLKSSSIQKFMNVREYNNGELVPWLDGDEEKMIRTNEDQEMFNLNTARYQADQQRAIDMHLIQLQYATHQRSSFNAMFKRPFNTVQGFFMPEPKKKKNYSERYYTAKNKQRNPNPKRICKAIWQDDGLHKGCGQNSHPKGVCACWKARGFEKKDLKNGRILAWLQMAYPGKSFDM